MFLVGVTNDARGGQGERPAEGTRLRPPRLPCHALQGLEFAASVFQVSTPLPYLSEASDLELGELGEGV